MARGGCTLVRMMVAGLLVLAALALFAPSSARAHVHSAARTPVHGVWVGDADHAPPADDACGGKHGLSCGGTCPMTLSGIVTVVPFAAPPLRVSAPFRPSGLLPEGIGTLPALKPPRMPV